MIRHAAKTLLLAAVMPALACKPSPEAMATGRISACAEHLVPPAETVTLRMPPGSRKPMDEDVLAVLDRRLALVRHQGAGHFCASVQLPEPARRSDARKRVLERWLRDSGFTVVDALERPQFGVGPHGHEVHVRVQRCYAAPQSEESR